MAEAAIGSPLTEIGSFDPCVADTDEPGVLMHPIQSVVRKIDPNETSSGSSSIGEICGGGRTCHRGATFLGIGFLLR